VIVENGGTVISQDEKSSVVWGMPAAVANAGLCSVVLPLDGLSSYVMRIAGRVAK
ncbi:MAG TPA: chemotaxis response regulator protein-glutamate methylesterase, partial [Rhodospirillales bacterium]|nr:chemotaxis response regulator protein-glutamate methylesterase [Rhodospirillales bacterium]